MTSGATGLNFLVSPVNIVDLDGNPAKDKKHIYLAETLEKLENTRKTRIRI